jgi:hypothetical protein
MNELKSQKILQGKKEIMKYCDISETLFVKFIKSGMPAIQIDGRWYAHAENLDDYFKAMTRISMRNMSEEDIEKSL